MRRERPSSSNGKTPVQKETGESIDRAKSSETPKSSFTLLSDVTPQPIEWLWHLRIPLGEITIVDGDPGSNKSSAMLDLVARVSTGREMPDKTEGISGGVVLLLGEDSLRKTVVQRLAAADANMHRIAVMPGNKLLPDGLPDLETVAVQTSAKLIVIDPFMAFLNRDAMREQPVRKAMTPLKEFAERTNIAVVILLETLAAGPVEQWVIRQKAAALGMAFRTVERAKTELGVTSRHVGFGNESAWVWDLPTGDENGRKRL